MSTRDKTKILYELDEVDRRGVWPDYLQYGFNEQDVPALLMLVADESLNNAHGESNEVWVPLHAWRTLGQIGNSEAITPLIALFDGFVKDDWAMTEIPRGMGMLGEAAIVPLTNYFNETHHNEFARTMAMESLAKMVGDHPEVRPQVIQCFKDYMHSPDKSECLLNGLLIACLMDIDAKKLINDIRQLFEKDCVDISCAGDLEEVEIELGFRTERSTPKPNYGQLYEMEIPSELPKPNNDDVLEDIDYTLMRYGHDDSILDASEMDGFFAALACAPNTIMPSQWMPAIWGGEAQSPEWQNKKEFETFSRAVFALYNHVMESLNEDDYQALFQERVVAEKTYTIVDEWCEGFLRGINLWGPLAASDAGMVEQQIQPLRLFATEVGFKKRDTMSDDEVEAQQQLIEPSVRELFQHFYEQRKQAKAPVVRDQQKVGRNDPCICGSGKKYKKCCLHW